ncbi:hypothetical protein ACLMJK_008642 [Lecanora helva]
MKNRSTSVGPNGFTYTSPSVYIVYQSISATNDCGQILGETTVDLTLSFTPPDVTTFTEFDGGYGYRTIDFATLYNNCTERYTYSDDFANPPCVGTAKAGGSLLPYCESEFDKSKSAARVVQNHCYPQLSFPPPNSLQKLNTAWEQCDIANVDVSVIGVFDPPRALTPSAAMAAANPTNRQSNMYHSDAAPASQALPPQPDKTLSPLHSNTGAEDLPTINRGDPKVQPSTRISTMQQTFHPTQSAAPSQGDEISNNASPIRSVPPPAPALKASASYASDSASTVFKPSFLDQAAPDEATRDGAAQYQNDASQDASSDRIKSNGDSSSPTFPAKNDKANGYNGVVSTAVNQYSTGAVSHGSSSSYGLAVGDKSGSEIPSAILESFATNSVAQTQVFHSETDPVASAQSQSTFPGKAEISQSSALLSPSAVIAAGPSDREMTVPQHESQTVSSPTTSIAGDGTGGISSTSETVLGDGQSTAVSPHAPILWVSASMSTLLGSATPVIGSYSAETPSKGSPQALRSQSFMTSISVGDEVSAYLTTINSFTSELSLHTSTSTTRANSEGTYSFSYTNADPVSPSATELVGSSVSDEVSHSGQSGESSKGASSTQKSIVGASGSATGASSSALAANAAETTSAKSHALMVPFLIIIRILFYSV